MVEKSQTGGLDAPAVWGVEKCFHSLVVLLLLATLLDVVYLRRESADEDVMTMATTTSSNLGMTTRHNLLKTEKSDLFSGRWVNDNITYPLYKEKECKYMSDQLACNEYGRKDLMYQQYRWQSHACDLPCPLPLLGKRLGLTRACCRSGSCSLGTAWTEGSEFQWFCLVKFAILPSFKSISFRHNNSLAVFHAADYNASMEFYWAVLLVESNSNDPFNHRVPDHVIRVQAIENHARHWSDADFLVFNSYLWWRRPKMKVLRGPFEEGNGQYKDVPPLRAYEMALQMWSDWVEIHVNRTKTLLVFVTTSPPHEKAEERDGVAGRNCWNEMGPIVKEGYRGSDWDQGIMRVMEMAMERQRKKGLVVEVLNITRHSESRKEAHPTIYKRQWERK